MIKLSALLFSVSLFCSISAFAKRDVAAGPTKTKTSTAPARAAAPVQESYYANFDYELQTALSRGGLESKKAGGETNTIIEGQVSLTKVIKSNIQVGAEAHFFNQSGGGGSSYFEALGMVVYNIDNNLKESLYGKLGVGMMNVVNDKFKNEAKVAFMVGGGKRIPVLDKIAYTPEGRIIIVDGATRFQIMALNFSLFY